MTDFIVQLHRIREIWIMRTAPDVTVPIRIWIPNYIDGGVLYQTMNADYETAKRLVEWMEEDE